MSIYYRTALFWVLREKTNQANAGQKTITLKLRISWLFFSLGKSTPIFLHL